MDYPFLKKEKVGAREQMVVTCDKLEIFIPQEYFDIGIAVQIGSDIETIGIFIFKAENKTYELALPISMMFSYSDRSKFTGKLTPSLNSDDYHAFTLIKGDAFCLNLKPIRDTGNLNVFLEKFIENAKMPRILGYDSLLPVFMNAIIACGTTKLGVSSLTYELILSEIFRSKNNIIDPFRIYIDKNPNNVYDYQRVKLTKLAELNSTFTGLLGEDKTQQVTAAVVYNRSGRTEKTSPLEKLLKL